MAAMRRKTPPRSNSNLGIDRPVRHLKVGKQVNLKTLYARVRSAFGAADLQRYATDERMIPAEQLTEELEAMQRDGGKLKKRPTAS